MLDYQLLEGQRVKLGRLKEDDISTIVSWYEDEEFLRNLDALPSFPKREAEINTNDSCFNVDHLKCTHIFLFSK